MRYIVPTAWRLVVNTAASPSGTSDIMGIVPRCTTSEKHAPFLRVMHPWAAEAVQ